MLCRQYFSGCSAVGSAPALGQNAERCQWQRKRGVLWAAVDKIEDQRKPDDFIGYRNLGDQSSFPFSRLFISYSIYPGVAQLVARLLWELKHQIGSTTPNVGYSPVCSQLPLITSVESSSKMW